MEQQLWIFSKVMASERNKRNNGISARNLVRMMLLLVVWSIGTIVIFSIWVSLSVRDNELVIYNNELLRSRPDHEQFQRLMKNAPTCTTIVAEDVTFTLVTQLSEERLWMLQHHCERWDVHPISIALFTRRTRVEVEEDLTKLGCILDTLIISIHYEDGDYPINHLRNLAISAVQTTHFVYVDVDFWPSKGMHAALSSTVITNELVKDDKLAIVVPVFQIDREGPGCHDHNDSTRKCDASNIARMVDDRPSLLELILSRQAHIFDPTNPGGHNSTGYLEWITQDHLELRDIKCVQSNRYEPYFACRFCNVLPPFQEHFTGYGKNKLTWAMQIRRSGYRFMVRTSFTILSLTLNNSLKMRAFLFQVIRSSFLLHFPHVESAARESWNERPNELHYGRNPITMVNVDWNSYKRGAIDNLYLQFKAWLSETKDESRVPMCYESTDDESNLWVDR